MADVANDLEDVTLWRSRMTYMDDERRQGMEHPHYQPRLTKPYNMPSALVHLYT